MTGIARGAAGLLLLAAVFVGGAMQAQAQTQTQQAPAQAAPGGEVFQDWTVRCDQNPGNAAAGGCFIYQNVVNTENQKAVMHIAVGYLSSDKTPAAVITLPLGIRLPPGVAVQIDENQPQRVPVERCLPEGCKVQFRMDAAQVSSFKAGIGGKLTFQDAGGRAVAIPFSLKGFTAALNAIGS